MDFDFSSIKRPLAKVLECALAGNEINQTQGVRLLQADGDDLRSVVQVANYFRRQKHGNKTTFVVTRNINFTNVCHMGCHFCGFGKHKDAKDAELLPMDEIARRALEASQRGATEVCIQGGLHPDISGDHYRNIILAVKAAVPNLHIHAFSPFEIYYGSRKKKLSYQEFLWDLKECGLNSIPGTAAEILDVDIRKILTKNKLSTDAWVDIIKDAHRVGLKSTATMMYGHVDQAHHWAAHISLLRDIQKQTEGFTEFVPLGFVHYDSPLYLENKAVRPGPTRRESIAVHATARIMLHNHIDNIQVSWVKLGPQFAKQMQSFGVNDLGGTLMNESISRSSGALYGQEITAAEMAQMIHYAGYQPVQRNTVYEHLNYPDVEHLEKPQDPMVERTVWQNQQITRLEVAEL